MIARLCAPWMLHSVRSRSAEVRHPVARRLVPSESRKERESRRNQHVTRLKEVRIEPKIGKADLETKGRQAAR